MVSIARALAFEREHQAGKHRLAVDQHRAGAAFAELAAVLGAGEVEVLAQHLEQRLVRRERDFDVLAVDAQHHVHVALRLDFRICRAVHVASPMAAGRAPGGDPHGPRAQPPATMLAR